MGVTMTAIKDIMKELMVIVEAIGESDLFKGVSPEFLKEIGKSGEVHHFKSGALIFRANEEAQYLYQLMEGRVDIVMSEEDGIDFTVDRPGEILGWSALVQPYRYTATTKCMTDVKTVRLPRESVEEVIRRHPADGLAIMRRLTGIIAHRLRHAYLYIYNKE
jgi:CRP-like cAMP-binding protein